MRAAGSDVIRVGVIGCGGRGTGAARDCLRGSPGVDLVSLGDLFPDQLTKCRNELAKAAQAEPALAERIKVTDDRCFTGFDAFRQVHGSDFEVVRMENIVE